MGLNQISWCLTNLIEFFRRPCSLLSRVRRMSFRPKHLPFEEIVTFFGKLLSHIASLSHVKGSNGMADRSFRRRAETHQNIAVEPNQATDMVTAPASHHSLVWEVDIDQIPRGKLSCYQVRSPRVTLAFLELPEFLPRFSSNYPCLRPP